jgi:glutamate/tyrosine decarboxylase-like PLP-dependent enzyme
MSEFLDEAYSCIRKAAAISVNVPARPIPSPEALEKARDSLPRPGSAKYMQELGYQDTLEHLLNDITPALNGGNRSSKYWSHGTGATLPIAEMADNLVSAFDQDVALHLPEVSIATEVEDRTLHMLLDLFELGGGISSVWQGRTITTGAAPGNILGLACGREAVIRKKLGDQAVASVGDLGLLAACAKAGIREIQILANAGHSSLLKAASVVGLGKSSVKVLALSADEPWRLDLNAVERELKREGSASIIALSASDVTTGRFAFRSPKEMVRLRELADKYGAWIHVDGAFGLYARALPATEEFALLREHASELHLADSIAVDLHTLLNVPHDTGVFVTRSASMLHDVCSNSHVQASSHPDVDEAALHSPINLGVDGARRFRALPVYAVLLCEGQARIANMLGRMVRAAQGIAQIIAASSEYTLLPEKADKDTHVCVLFRAKDDKLNDELLATINNDRVWHVSAADWKGQRAIRIIVASWRISVNDVKNEVAYYLGTYSMEHKHGKWRR